MSSSSGVSSTRWLAYDSRDVDVNNVELEPGNGRRREVAWSEERAASAGCRWTGVHKHAQAAAVTSTLAASAVPHRTLTISDAGTRKPIAQRDVYFLPHSFLDLPAALSVPPHTSTSTLCSDLLERTIDGFIQADSISQGDAYARFRFVWMQARGDAGSNEGSGDRKEEEEQLFTKHTNLFAPITTHDHKTFVSNVLRSVRTTNADGPDTTFSRMDTTLQAERCGMLPQIPFAGDISDPRAMLVELLATIVHTQMCVTREWNLDARTWSGEITTEKITAGWEASCQHVSEWLSALLERHLRYLSFLARCYRELMPAKTLLQILDTALPFSWKDPFVQAGLVWYVMNDAVAMQYPPSIDHRLDVWKTLSQAIEDEGVLEVHSDILLRIQELTRMKGKAEPAELAQSHWTVTYRDDVDPSASSSSSLQTCTLKMETGFSSTTGCSLWPAGMLMCEFILANRHIFEGKRVLELGVGIGLTTIMLHRAGVKTLICTDCDEKALKNLRTNFEINHVPIASYDDTPSSSSSGGLLPPGVHLLHLDWSSPSRSGVLARCRPDVIVACDTIYLPELHQDQGTVVREGMKMGQAAATATVTAAAGSFSTASSSSSARYPCAYFAQMNRNPETFVHYLQTFRELGLHVESQTEEAAVSTPKRFAYDRQAIEFHRFTLPQALADA